MEIGEIRYAKDVGYQSKRYDRVIWARCATCGVQRWVLFRKGKPQTTLCRACNLSRFNGTGESHHNWRGGKTKTVEGYKLIGLAEDDFFYPMANKYGRVLVHRLVMAKHLGRCLHRWEIVHHKNHDRTDNRIENLQLVTEGRHTQITLLENRITNLEKRIILLEAENVILEEELASRGARQSPTSYTRG